MLKTNKSKFKLMALVFVDFIGSLLLFPFYCKKLFSKNKKSNDFHNILILELWGIGDLVIMSIVLKALQDRYPNSRITLLSKPVAEELFSNGGIISEFIKFNFPWTKHKNKYFILEWDWKRIINVIRFLRGRKFDLIIDARGDIRNNLLSFLIGGKRRVGFDWTGGGYFLTDTVNFDFRKKHRLQAWISLLDYLGIERVNYQPYITHSETATKNVMSILQQQGINNGDFLVGIHPGSGLKNKCWPLYRFAKVAEYVRDKYGAKIIVFIEPEGYGQDISIIGKYLKFRLPLPELLAALKKVNLLICNDGGAMHLSAAVGTPVVAIFGSADPDWFAPYGEENTLIFNKRFNCRPCFDRCKYGDPLCINEISVEEVIKGIDKSLKEYIKR